MSSSLEDTFDTGSWEPVVPGWDVDELLDLDPSDYTPAGLFTAVKAAAKAEAMLHARKLELLAALQHAKQTETPPR